MKKRRGLIYLLLGILFMGTLLFAWLSYNHSRTFILESVDRETDELLNNFTIEVDRFLQERLTNIELIADHIPYLLDSREDVALFLTKQRESIPYFADLAFFMPGGEVEAATGQCFPVEQRDDFLRAFRGEVVFSDVFKLEEDELLNNTAIYVPVVTKDGRTLGVVAGVINVCNLVSKLTEESNLPATVYLLQNGEVLFTSASNEQLEQFSPINEGFLRALADNKSGSWVDPQDDLRFIKYKTAREEWVVVVDSVTNKATDKIAQRWWINLGLVLTILTIIAVISAYLTRLQEGEKRQQEQDLLTGFGNRVYLEENIASEMIDKGHLVASMYYIKLDCFLEMTERMGHALSDEVLFVLSTRLKSEHREMTVYRVGDEEFVVMGYFAEPEARLAFADELVDKISWPIYIRQGRPVLLTASIGVRTASTTDSVQVLMQDAFFASRVASKRGGNQYVYFTEALAEASKKQRQLIANLEHALANDEFYLVYQPIYSIAENKIVSFEALMRWKSPVIGEVGPGTFIPLLEADDAIIAAGYWLIQEVSEQVQRFEQAGYDDFSIALNISTKQVQDEGFLQTVKQVIADTGVDPSRLVFEVTESVVVEDVAWAKYILQSLNDLGIKTAIDDFGTGYSSLAILKALPFHYMKLDRAFVREVMSDGGVSEAILGGLIEIASSMNLLTIAEGVETAEQLQILKEVGAHRIQGYYFSRPVTAQEALTFLDHEAFRKRLFN